ncbi:MAG: hypothetical protein KC656_13270, partial [Myxococcales bacterium]|nr:hypothetical protein [Myxococcales bacterium]
WMRFRTDWAGTTVAKKAREAEAAARLRDIGTGAAESDYTTFLEEYADTASAGEARLRQAEAALKSIQTDDDARRVARAYPGAKGLERAIAPHFASFVTVSTEGGKPTATLDPEITLPGQELRVEWAGRTSKEAVPWDLVALRHLEAQGLPNVRARLLLPRGGGFPTCTLPDAEVGVRVRLGPLEAFVPHQAPCGGKSPGFVSVRDGRVVGLALGPGTGLRLAGADGPRHVLWGEATRVPLLGDLGEDVIPQGEALSQQVGTAYLQTPLSGGLPWYGAEAPPPSAQPLPTGAEGTMPKGTSTSALPSGDLQIEVAGSAPRTVANGTVRVMSPLYQELTGLHDGHGSLGTPAITPFPAGFWPEGSAAVEVEPDRREAVVLALKRFGVAFGRGWQVQMDADDELEIALEGRLGDRQVRGLLDHRPKADSWRLYLVEAPAERDAPIVFRHAGATHFAWVGTLEGRPAMEALRTDPRGLTHTWIRP